MTKQISRWDARILALCSVVILLVFILACFVVIRNQPFADPNIVVLLHRLVAVAVAGFMATLPGFLNIRWITGKLALRAGGASAAFFVALKVDPSVILQQPVAEPPTRLAILLDKADDRVVHSLPIRAHEDRVTTSDAIVVQQHLLHDISVQCENLPLIVSHYGKAIGIVPNGTNDLSVFCQRMEVLMTRLQPFTSGSRTQRQVAEAALISTLISLWQHGPQAPAYDNPDDINKKYNLLFDSLLSLSSISTDLPHDRLFHLILRVRFMISQAIGVLQKRCEQQIRIQPKDAKMLKDCNTELALRIEEARESDGMLYFDYLTLMLKAGKISLLAGFGICNRVIDSTPITEFSSKESLQLRFHILRLFFFFNSATQLINGVMSASNDLLPILPIGITKAVLGSLALVDPDQKASKIDESFRFIRSFISRQNKTAEEKAIEENLAYYWFDTLLCFFVELRERLGENDLWNHMAIFTMIREQMIQSEKLIEKLRVSGDLTPDFVHASMLLHIAGTRILRYAEDPIEFERIAKVAMAYFKDLTTSRGIKHSPLRSENPEIFMLSVDCAEYRYLVKLLESFDGK